MKPNISLMTTITEKIAFTQEHFLLCAQTKAIYLDYAETWKIFQDIKIQDKFPKARISLEIVPKMIFFLHLEPVNVNDNNYKVNIA